MLNVKTRTFVYLSHFLSTWGDRMWAFGVGMFMIEISPESLQLTAVYGFSSGTAILFFGALVGYWIDNTARLRAARMSLVIQNLFVILCAAVVFVVLQYKDILSTYWDDEWLLRLCFGVIIVIAVGANVSSLAYKIAVERDWVVEICGRDKDMLASMTATLRRIDLTSMILAPIATGQIMTFASTGIGALFIAGWNICSVFIEYYLIWKVYQTVPALRMKQFKKKSEIDCPVQDTELKTDVDTDTRQSPSLEHDKGKEMIVIKPNISNNESEDRQDGNTKSEIDMDSGDNYDRLEKEAIDDSSKSKNSAAACDRSRCCTKLFSSFITLYRGWRIYIKYKVAFAGLGLASLYMTVLGFDNITTGFAISQGLSESIVGVVMGAGALAGILGTVAYPLSRRRVGLERTGLFGLAAQISCLCLCVASVFAPGSPLDLLYWQRNETSLATAVQTNTSDICVYVTNMCNGTETQDCNNTSVQMNFTSIGCQRPDDLQIIPDHSYISISLLMAGIIGARFGLWMADLAITQLFLEQVIETERGIVSGVQNSLNRLLDMLKFVMVIIAPQPQMFGILIIISFVFVVMGWALYAMYSYKARGHLFHFEKITQCVDFHNNNALPPLVIESPILSSQDTILENVSV